jgi:beta-galactosidase/beta-glucuronidase
MSSPLPLWDEFSPKVQTLTARLSASGPQGSYADTHTTTFGMRSLGIVGKQFTLNRRPIMLRGTLECCIFPLTGYPPMDEAAWDRIFTVCSSHGLNHMRFHSWCPPEAAFAAADRAGFLLSGGTSGANVGGPRP